MIDASDSVETTVARGFTRRVLFRQVFVCIVSYLVILLLSPWALMGQVDPFSVLATSLGVIGSAGVAVTGLLSWIHLRKQQEVVASVTLQPERVTPKDIGHFANTPFALTVYFLLVGTAVSILIALPPLRTDDIDGGRAVSLMVLSFSLIGASSLVHYVVIRSATLSIVELSPLEAITTWLEQQALRRAPRDRLTRKVIMSVIVPVALLGAGAVTVSYAHVRNFLEESRIETSLIVARSALEPTPLSRSDRGRDEAIAAVTAQGFMVRLERNKDDKSDGRSGAQRLANGQLLVRAPLDDGQASIRFATRLRPESVTGGVVVALLALLLAGAIASLLGRGLASDLMMATRAVSQLGTNQKEDELIGPKALAQRARFREVVGLAQGIRQLDARFQLFTEAQELALEAKEQDRRMKQLLFASVSHDLKSPLNAVLGFADLISDQPLSPGQRESIDMVGSRGRELLALIETILDAARVDAGQLSVSPQMVDAGSLLANAAAKARQLHARANPEISVEAQPHLPSLFVDPVHTARAIGVLISHAIESQSHPRASQVRVSAQLAERRESEETPHLCIRIEFNTPAGRTSLLQGELQGVGSPNARRSMVMQLSLARSVIELHGGRVTIKHAGPRASVVRCYLPIWQPNSPGSPLS